MIRHIGDKVPKGAFQNKNKALKCSIAHIICKGTLRETRRDSSSLSLTSNSFFNLSRFGPTPEGGIWKCLLVCSVHCYTLCVFFSQITVSIFWPRSKSARVAISMTWKCFIYMLAYMGQLANPILPKSLTCKARLGTGTLQHSWATSCTACRSET